jgi:hypothetical protein
MSASRADEGRASFALMSVCTFKISGTYIGGILARVLFHSVVIYIIYGYEKQNSLLQLMFPFETFSETPIRDFWMPIRLRDAVDHLKS